MIGGMIGLMDISPCFEVSGRQGKCETYGVGATAGDYGHTQRDPSC